MLEVDGRVSLLEGNFFPKINTKQFGNRRAFAGAGAELIDEFLLARPIFSSFLIEIACANRNSKCWWMQKSIVPFELSFFFFCHQMIRGGRFFTGFYWVLKVSSMVW